MLLSFTAGEKTLKEFLFDNETVGLVGVKSPYMSQEKRYYLVVKVVDSNKTISLYGKYVPCNPGEVCWCDLSRIEHILSANSEHKYVIIVERWGIDINSELEELTDYRFVTPRNFVDEIKERYKSKFKELITLELPKIRSTEEYKKAYEMQSDENKEYYKRTIRNLFLEDKEETRSYSINFLNEYKSSYTGVSLSLSTDKLDNLHLFLSQENAIEELATHNFHHDYDIKNIASVDLYNTLKEEIYANPDEEMVLSRKIREAIKDAGKTLNVKVKGSNSYEKVKNDFFYGESFHTVTGYRSIYIKDIEEIKFGKNILYKAE